MIGRLLVAAALLLIAVGAAAAWAVEPSERLADPALEARARTISQELRCLVCQNQSIDEFNADLAHDLRVLVRKRLLAGDTDQQVLDYIVARYGVFVLLDPPFAAGDLGVVAGAAGAGAGGGQACCCCGRAGGVSTPALPELTREESARAAELLSDRAWSGSGSAPGS